MTTKIGPRKETRTLSNNITSTGRSQELLQAVDLSSPFFSSNANSLFEDSRVFFSDTRAPAADISLEQSINIPFEHSSDVNPHFRSADITSEEQAVPDLEDGKWRPPTSNSQARRRSSILQLQGWSAEGVQVKTHIKLQRAKLSENDAGQSQSKKSPAQMSDMMRAFNGTRHLPLAESEDCEIMSSSIPNISTGKPNRYFKKLKALVTSRHSKSCGELTSADINGINFKIPKGVDNKANQQMSESSTESLTDEETAVKAKNILRTIEPFKLAIQSGIEEAGTKTNGHATSQGSVASRDPVHDERISTTTESSPTNDNQKHTLTVPPSNSTSVSQTLLRTRSGSIKKRARTTSETNYSLLRPDMDDDHQGSSTVVFNRIPSIRHRHFQIRLLHHLHVTPDPDNPDDLQTLKDAPHVHPVDTDDVIVTDILSNRLVVFNKAGTPTITFAMEPGSEPWATCLTPDGDLVVTLKRQGCISLWSPSGEPISEFGHEYLSGPSGT